MGCLAWSATISRGAALPLQLRQSGREGDRERIRGAVDSRIKLNGTRVLLGPGPAHVKSSRARWPGLLRKDALSGRHQLGFLSSLPV